MSDSIDLLYGGITYYHCEIAGRLGSRAADPSLSLSVAPRNFARPPKIARWKRLLFALIATVKLLPPY